jgi:hypothetical protein
MWRKIKETITKGAAFMYRILELNPQLKDFSSDIDLRMTLYRQTKERLLGKEQTLNDFANAHNYYGIHHISGGWVYREWAPSAYQLYLTGEFNGWNLTSHPLTKLDNGCCGNCHMRVTNQTVNELSKGKIESCDNCQHLLYADMDNADE